MNSGDLRPKRNHSMSIIKDRYLFVYGGKSGSKILDKLEILDLMTGKTRVLNRKGFEDYPGPRYDHFSFLYNDHLYITGGSDEDMVFCDLWQLDISKLTWTKINLEVLYAVNEINSSSVLFNDLVFTFFGRRKNNVSI